MDRERELKYDLGGEEPARRLEARLGRVTSACWQVNRFFDSPSGDLRRVRLALRLRAEWPAADDWEPGAPEPAGALPGVADPPTPGLPAGPPGPPARIVWSLKGARRRDGALHDRPEREQPAGPGLWTLAACSPDQLPAAWLGLLPPGLSGQTLTEVVRFGNLRRRYPLLPRWQAEVDRTRFVGGGSVWEVEVELGQDEEAAGARRALEELLARAGIAPLAQERSKLQRALAARRP